MWSDLRGRTAVITGAGSGMGRGTALAMARNGANVVVADLDPARADSVAAEARDAGARALAAPCDVGVDGELDAVRDRAIEEFGQVDILMNNAGVLAMGLPENIPVAAWARVLNVNLLGAVRGVQAFLPAMLERGEGHIITTASLAGLYPYSYDRLPYAASKAALVVAMEDLFLYVRPRGVGVTCLCPGPVTTDFSSQKVDYGAKRGTRGPGFSPVTAEHVGDLVVDAVLSGTFFLLTHPEVMGELRAHADDRDAYLLRQVGVLAAEDGLPF